MLFYILAGIEAFLMFTLVATGTVNGSAESSRYYSKPAAPQHVAVGLPPVEVVGIADKVHDALEEDD
jgi:hypothetical protein